MGGFPWYSGHPPSEIVLKSDVEHPLLQCITLYDSYILIACQKVIENIPGNIRYRYLFYEILFQKNVINNRI